MINYTETLTDNSQLSTYIESYVTLSFHSIDINSKTFLTRSGANLLLSNVPISVNNEVEDTNIILGISHKPSKIYWEGNPSGKAVLIKFSPYGLSRFTDIPIVQMSNTAFPACKLFGNSIQKLSNQVMQTDNISKKIEQIEQVLLDRFIEPNETEKIIFKLADTIKRSVETSSTKPIRREIPLGKRQLERNFKRLIGYNIQAFNRICKFENAKNKLIKEQLSSLTEIGYQSGYFDQSHFIREFKRFTSFSPKYFFQNAPFYRLIANVK